MDFKAYGDPTRRAAFEELICGNAIDHEPNQTLEG
jgi:hypothetical protein